MNLVYFLGIFGHPVTGVVPELIELHIDHKIGQFVLDLPHFLDFLHASGLVLPEPVQADEPVQLLNLLGQFLDIVDSPGPSLHLLDALPQPLPQTVRDLPQLDPMFTQLPLLLLHILLDVVESFVNFASALLPGQDVGAEPRLQLGQAGQALLDQAEVEVQELGVEGQSEGVLEVQGRGQAGQAGLGLGHKIIGFNISLQSIEVINVMPVHQQHSIPITCEGTCIDKLLKPRQSQPSLQLQPDSMLMQRPLYSLLQHPLDPALDAREYQHWLAQQPPAASAPPSTGLYRRVFVMLLVQQLLTVEWGGSVGCAEVLLALVTPWAMLGHLMGMLAPVLLLALCGFTFRFGGGRVQVLEVLALGIAHWALSTALDYLPLPGWLLTAAAQLGYLCNIFPQLNPHLLCLLAYTRPTSPAALLTLMLLCYCQVRPHTDVTVLGVMHTLMLVLQGRWAWLGALGAALGVLGVLQEVDARLRGQKRSLGWDIGPGVRQYY